MRTDDQGPIFQILPISYIWMVLSDYSLSKYNSKSILARPVDDVWIYLILNTIPLTTGQMFGWLFLSVVVLKHIISKRNEPLPWHKITIKITSVLLNGHVCNSFILFLFQISTLFMLINFLSIRNERVFRIKNVKTIFSSFYSDWLNLLLKNL